jgi:hypothetical protein
VIPERVIALQCLKWLQERANISRRVFLLERFLYRLHQIAKPNRILLVVRMVPMRGLVEREARRLRGVKNAGGKIIDQ